MRAKLPWQRRVPAWRSPSLQWDTEWGQSSSISSHQPQPTPAGLSFEGLHPSSSWKIPAHTFFKTPESNFHHLMSGLHLHSCRLRTGNEDAELIVPQCISPKRVVCWHILTVSENVSHATTHTSFLNLSQHNEKSTAVPVLEQGFSSWKQILTHHTFRLYQLRMDFHFCSLHKSL